MSDPTGAPPPPPPPDAGKGGGVLGRFRKQGTAAPVSDAPVAPSAEVDPVTGLPSRQHLHEWVKLAVKRSHASSSRAVVAFVGVGLLRDINDAFGADAGDRLLAEVGSRLAAIDMPGTRVARYEGAEFAVVLEQVNHVNALESVAAFLVEEIARPLRLGQDEVTVKPAVGAAISADNYEDVGDLIRDAHRALAQARDAGTDWEIHDESKRGRYETRLDESRLSSALDDHEFVLVYQPIVVVATGQIAGFEAFVRWRSPGATNVGLLLPHDFLPMMEKTGMSVRLGEWILDEACSQLAAWRSFQPAGSALFVACNVGGRQLASDGFADAVLAAISRHDLDPSQVCLDITESSLRFTGAGAWPMLRGLHAAGVRLGLDDFGTGMSSLQYLLEFSLHYIRIAQAFIQHVGGDSHMAEPAAAIISRTAAMAADLGIVSIAEGVEHETQAQELDGLGVHLGQGYHFGRPVTADATLGLLDPSQASDDTWDTSQVLDQD